MEGPEKIFPDKTIEGAIYLGRLLIQYQKQIKEDLKNRGCDREFSDKIADWRETLPPDYEEANYEKAARRLFEICCQYGVIEFMINKRLISMPIERVRGVDTVERVRGVDTVYEDFKKIMEKVVELFS
jgi:hypothetical protein